MMKKFFTIVPNLLSLSRILISLTILIMSNYNSPPGFGFFALFCVAGISDFFDGYLARKWKVESRLGKILDPIGDKILLNSTMWIFHQSGFIDSWIFTALCVRDILIIIGAMLLAFARKNDSTIAISDPSMLGKISTALHIILCAACFLIGPCPLWLWLIVVFLSILSLMQYAVIFVKNIKSDR